MLRPLLALALLAAATAGCLGSEEPAAEVVENTSCPADAPCQDCSAEADCLAWTPEPNATALPATVRAVPFEFTGNTGGALCPPAGRSHCVTIEESRIDAPELQGAQPLALVANVTWTAATPATTEFYVSVLVDQGEGWEWDPETSPSIAGASPIAVDWDLSAYPPGAKFLLYFECYQALDAGGQHASVVLPQDFAVAGAFMHAAG